MRKGINANMSRNIATAAFIAASGMGHADEAPDLTYVMLQPNFVLYDTLAHTDLVFIEAENKKVASLLKNWRGMITRLGFCVSGTK